MKPITPINLNVLVGTAFLLFSLEGTGCQDLSDGCVPDLGTIKVKGQVGPLLECGDASGPVLPITDPILRGRARDAGLILAGDNHDDSPVGCGRHVNARVELIDDNGDLWFVYFGPRASSSGKVHAPCGSCLAVERKPNVDGYAVWTFHTEPPHLGYLYFDNRPPHSPSQLHGVVSLPFSGTLVSLAQSRIRRGLPARISPILATARTERFRGYCGRILGWILTNPSQTAHELSFSLHHFGSNCRFALPTRVVRGRSLCLMSTVPSEQKKLIFL